MKRLTTLALGAALVLGTVGLSVAGQTPAATTPPAASKTKLAKKHHKRHTKAAAVKAATPSTPNTPVTAKK